MLSSLTSERRLTGMAHDTDSAELAELVATFARGWNAGSGALLAGAFAEDADFINIMGLHARGRDLIARGHDEILATIFHGTRLTAAVDAIRFIRPDVAAVEATFTLQMADGQPFTGPASRSKPGFVATKDAGGWSIVVFRNMVPFARPAAGPLERSLAGSSR